jgi:uncharacterized membrane protein YdbT with pleckstrin-like domain
MASEQVYLKFHPTRLAYAKWYLLAFIVAGMGIVIALSAFKLGPFSIPIGEQASVYTLIIPLIGMAIVIVPTLLRRDDTYTITNFRIIEKKGILNIKEDSVNWEKVSNYTLEQNVLDRILKIGNINLYSVGGADDKDAEVTIKKAPNIHKIKELLDKLIERKGLVV